MLLGATWCLMKHAAWTEPAHMHDAARIVALVADADQYMRHAKPCHDLRGRCRCSGEPSMTLGGATECDPSAHYVSYMSSRI
jgi:hypothetical protein